MKRYTVVYLAEAEDNLIAIWADATDRDEVTASANAADRILANTPLENSVLLREQLRRLDVPPLSFYFEIREEDRLASISNVVRESGELKS
jgi:hypothetical protein